MRRAFYAVALLAGAPLAASAQSVKDSTLRRELDSLQAVQTATSRYCRTSSATGYMRMACGILDRSVTRLLGLLPSTAPAPVIRLSLTSNRDTVISKTNPAWTTGAHDAIVTAHLDSAGVARLRLLTLGKVASVVPVPHERLGVPRWRNW